MNYCPVCHDSTAVSVSNARDIYCVECRICGYFDITMEAFEDFLDRESPVGLKLTKLNRTRLAHCVQMANSNSSRRPTITSDFLDKFISDGCPGPSPAKQVINIIRYVGDEVSRSGRPIAGLPENFYVIIGAPSSVIAGQLVVELNECNLVKCFPPSYTGSMPKIENISLTLDGWERYEAEKQGKIVSDYGFIALKFGNAALDRFVESVKPMVKRHKKFDLVDMRDVGRAGIIDNIMRSQIRDAAFVIVDLTHDNSGAYWEAGYAEGLGKPVIYICEREKFEEAKTHFDTNHCTTVLWTSGEIDPFVTELIATLRRSLNLFPSAA